MNNIPDLEKWLRTMGYTGNMPLTMSSVCNTSSEHVWDQLIRNLKPIQEVEEIRRKIMTYRLKKKSLDRQNEFEYNIEQISLYNKKRKLENQVKHLRMLLQDKKEQLNVLSHDNKIKVLITENKKAKINVTEEKTYLLDQKRKILEKEIKESQEELNLFTATELDESTNVGEITETLQECAKKFELSLRSIPISIFNGGNTMSHTSSTTRYHRRRNLFSAQKNYCLDESLQLLPDSCFNDSNSFLIKSNFNCPSSLNRHNFTPNSTRSSLMSLPGSTAKKNNVKVNVAIFLIEKCSSDKVCKDKLKDLLLKHRGQTIWNVFIKLKEKLQFDAPKNFQMEKIIKESTTMEDITQLRMYHIQNELEVWKNKIEIQKFKEEIHNRRKQFENSLDKNCPTNCEKIINSLELTLEIVSVDAAIQAIKEERIASRNIESNSDLQSIIQNLTKIKEVLERKRCLNNHYIEACRSALNAINRTSDETLSLLQNLLFFIQHSSWSCNLTQSLNSQEVNTFEEFPLAYNKSCQFMNSVVSFYEICSDDVLPLNISLGNDVLSLTTDILENPFSPPEVILLKILKEKKKLEVLKTVETVCAPPQFTNYSLEDLKRQESYIQYALDKLLQLKHSDTGHKILSMDTTLRQMVNIWKEIPFKDIIAPDKLVDDKPFVYYEKEYEKYYRALTS